MSQESEFDISPRLWDSIIKMPGSCVTSESMTIDNENFDGGYLHLEGERCTITDPFSEFEKLYPDATKAFPVMFQEMTGNDDANLSIDDNGNSLAMIPTNTNWPGAYGFNISFGEESKRSSRKKSWIYSEDKEKLFINMNMPCKVRFHLDKLPEPNFNVVIRALPIFTSDDHVKEVVKRCYNHTHQDELRNCNDVTREHFVRCENECACYFTDPDTRRLSVTVPFDRPQAGNDYTEYLFKFMCLNSCPMIARRQTQIVFTLEIGGEVVGRRPLDIRVCACPGRDCQSEETQKKKTNGPTVVRTTSIEMVGYSSSKRRRVSDEPTRYMVACSDKASYEMVQKLRDVVESCMPKNCSPLSASAALGRSNSNTSSSSLSGPSTSNPPLAVELNGIKKEPMTVAEWLTSFGMMPYSDIFELHGYVQMEHLDIVTVEDLKKLCIGEQHFQVIWKEVEKYQQSRGKSGSLPNSQGSASSSQPRQAPRTFEITRLKFTKCVPFREPNQGSEEF